MGFVAWRVGFVGGQQRVREEDLGEDGVGLDGGCDVALVDVVLAEHADVVECEA